MKYYIGADLGTSALKLLLVGEDGSIERSVSESYPIAYPNPGWSEQNPEDWWNAFISGIHRLTDGIPSVSIGGIGVAGQMHGLVILDENDKVIRPAILWNDGRTADQTDRLNREIGKEKLSAYTANIAFAGFTAPKLLWLAENEPENFSKIDKIMLPKDYINYRLTGVHSTDYSDASGMLLLDVQNKRWSPQMLECCRVCEAQMPALFESGAVTGKVKPALAAELGLSEDTFVVAGAGDNAGAAIGTATVGEGRCNISLGTSGTVFISSDHFSVDRFNALHSFCHADGGYHLMGCILSAASCNKWFCEEILSTDDYTAEQAQITDGMLGRNHVYFLPYLMGERSPINDTDARGLFIGMRPDTKRSDMVLAVLEGVAFAIRDNVEVARCLGIELSRSTLCGGGARSTLWRKILCNLLGIELDIPLTEEGPGYGAALLAMSGDRGESVTDIASKLVQIKETVSPDPTIAARYEARYQFYRKIYPSVRTLYKEMDKE